MEAHTFGHKQSMFGSAWAHVCAICRAHEQRRKGKACMPVYDIQSRTYLHMRWHQGGEGMKVRSMGREARAFLESTLRTHTVTTHTVTTHTVTTNTVTMHTVTKAGEGARVGPSRVGRGRHARPSGTEPPESRFPKSP